MKHVWQLFHVYRRCIGSVFNIFNVLSTTHNQVHTFQDTEEGISQPNPHKREQLLLSYFAAGAALFLILEESQSRRTQNLQQNVNVNCES